jgi:hypothetical protein
MGVVLATEGEPGQRGLPQLPTTARNNSATDSHRRRKARRRKQ